MSVKESDLVGEKKPGVIDREILSLAWDWSWKYCMPEILWLTILKITASK